MLLSRKVFHITHVPMCTFYSNYSMRSLKRAQLSVISLGSATQSSLEWNCLAMGVSKMKNDLDPDGHTHNIHMSGVVPCIISDLSRKFDQNPSIRFSRNVTSRTGTHQAPPKPPPPQPQHLHPHTHSPRQEKILYPHADR